MKNIFVKTLLLVFLVSFVAFADQTIDHDSGLTVTYPEGWTAIVDPANDENMLLSALDRQYLAAFSLVGGESAKGASANVLEEMGKMVRTPRIRDQQKGDINGMSAYVITGYGDHPYEYWIAAYVEHAGKVFMIRGAGSEGGWGWQDGPVASVIYSLKRK